MIAVLLAQERDRDRAVMAIGQKANRLCSSTTELANAISESRLCGIVCDLRDSSGTETLGALRTLQSRVAPPPVVVVVEPAAWALRQALRLAGLGLDVRFATRNQDDLAIQVASLASMTMPSHASAAVLRVVAGKLPSESQHLVVACLLHGFPRSNVPTVARACQLSTRSMERALAVDGIRPARWLLGWSTALNAVWRLEKLGHSIKQTAFDGGFTSRDAFAVSVRRQTGLSLPALRREFGFDALLDEFMRGLVGAPRRRGSFLADSVVM